VNKSSDLEEKKNNKLYRMRLSQTRRGQKKEKKGTLTTAIYSDHIACSFYSIFFIDQPTHNSLWLEANNIDSSSGCSTGTVDDEMKKRERKENKNERTREFIYERERSFFLLLHYG
jgi:hypothetical protein